MTRGRGGGGVAIRYMGAAEGRAVSGSGGDKGRVGEERGPRLDRRALPMIVAAAAIVAGGIVVFNLPDAPGGGGGAAPAMGGPSAPDLPVSSGPVTIMQYGHRLGDSVFVNVAGLMPGEAGAIAVLAPDGTAYRQYEYDGSAKGAFNLYFMPDTSARLGLCTAGDLVGTWTVVFAGGAYRPLQFAVTDEWVPGAEDTIDDEC